MVITHTSTTTRNAKFLRVPRERNYVFWMIFETHAYCFFTSLTDWSLWHTRVVFCGRCNLNRACVRACVRVLAAGVVGIVTRYGLEGLGFHLRCGREFPCTSISVPMPCCLPAQWVLTLFPGDKAAGDWRWPPTSFQRLGCVWVEL
jgi:hypothetical protein